MGARSSSWGCGSRQRLSRPTRCFMPVARGTGMRQSVCVTAASCFRLPSEKGLPSLTGKAAGSSDDGCLAPVRDS